MATIDKSKPVLVTGATGYVAGWIVKRLLEQGITVHAAVRNPDKKEKIAHLEKLGTETPGSIKFFKSDLLEEGSYAEAMAGCELVYHTASPFSNDVKDPQKELIDPALNGTKNVLNSANATSSVKRIVVTSSVVAIYTDASESHSAPGGMLTEEVWNTTASLDYQPYSYSKTLAEKAAWEMAEAQNQWDLVTINPSLVLGPPLNPKTTTSESLNMLKQMGDGSFKSGIPKVGMGLVDVRDVAEAHFQAGYNPEASGRYITMGHNSDFLAMAQALLPKYGNTYPIPKGTLPKWLLLLIGPMVNKVITRRFVRNNVNVEFKADNSKIKKELGINFRSIQETMEDSFQSLVDNKIL